MAAASTLVIIFQCNYIWIRIEIGFLEYFSYLGYPSVLHSNGFDVDWCGLNGRCVDKQQPWELSYTFECISRCYRVSLSEKCYGFISFKEFDQQGWAEVISLWHLLWRNPEVLWLKHKPVIFLSSLSLTQKIKCCCLLCHGVSAYLSHKTTMWPMKTENAAGEASMKEAWTSLSCIICILSEIINVLTLHVVYLK